MIPSHREPSHPGEILLHEFLRPTKMSQVVLAKKLGVTRQTIVSIEVGKYDPSIGLAFRMAHLFNVKIEDIFEYVGELGEFHGQPPAR